MGSKSLEEEIRSEVKTILQGADLSALSERNVREILSEKFGDAVQNEHVKKVITVRLFALLFHLMSSQSILDPHTISISFKQDVDVLVIHNHVVSMINA